MAKTSGIDWTKVDLQSDPVKVIAERLGVSSGAVIRAQKKFMVKSFSRLPNNPSSVDWGSLRLGTRPDAEIAREIGLTQGCVLKQRRKRGIPPFIPDLLSRWKTLPLGEVPDSVIGRKLGVQSNHVKRYREQLGIPLFPGLVRSQEGLTLQSQWEAKYDAYLHWKGIEHLHEVPFKDLHVRADFQTGDTFVEVAGMVGFKYYDNRVIEKKEIYRKAGMEVLWIEPDEIEELFRDCPLPLHYTKYAKSTCSSCGKSYFPLIGSKCRKCYQTARKETLTECRICSHCLIAFKTYIHHPNKFCNEECFSRGRVAHNKMDVDWTDTDWSLSNEEIGRLRRISPATVSRGRRSLKIPHKKARFKEILWNSVDWTQSLESIARELNVSKVTVQRSKKKLGLCRLPAPILDWDSVDWDNLALKEVAELMGVSISCAQKNRDKRGYKCGKKIIPHPHKLEEIDWSKVELGKMPDSVFALRLGISTGSVQRKRSSLGIPPSTPSSTV